MPILPKQICETYQAVQGHVSGQKAFIHNRNSADSNNINDSKLTNQYSN